MKNPNIYSRWLRKQLSEKEMAELKASGDLNILEKIITETDSWSLPDLQPDSLLQLKEKIFSGAYLQSEESTKVIPLNRKTNYWTWGIAASVLLVVFSVCFLIFFNNTITHQSLAGQQLKVILPDQSIVILNGRSSISYNEKTFLNNRKIDLEGEGYFEVAKKGEFNVAFHEGNVKVLGTRFTVLAGKNLSTIKCFEGKVMVTDLNKNNQVLTPGKGVRLIHGTTFLFELADQNPDWMNGESVFNNSPLLEVIDALSIQYNVEFETGNIDMQRNYSGKFVHNDLKTALTMVFIPMGIKFTIKESGKNKSIIILSE